jgi:hypothetical protein
MVFTHVLPFMDESVPCDDRIDFPRALMPVSELNFRPTPNYTEVGNMPKPENSTKELDRAEH